MAAFSRIERPLPAVVPMNTGIGRILLRKLLNHGINKVGAISFWDTVKTIFIQRGKGTENEKIIHDIREDILDTVSAGIDALCFSFE